MSQQVLERFHRALIEEIQTQRPEYLTASFTVAEIYQNLVPYGSHRDRIGVEMNGDYEDALIRLLAGEGGYLILDSEPALRDLKAELETPNPNTGLYREFAAVDVRLNQAYLDLSAAAMDQLPDLVQELDVEEPITIDALAPNQGMSTGPDLGIVPPGVDIFGDQESPQLGGLGSDPGLDVDLGASDPDESIAEAADPASPGRQPLAPEFVDSPTVEIAEVETDAGIPEPSKLSTDHVRQSGGACPWCRAELPLRPELNFCPFCGTDVKLVPCAACGEELEEGWRFCAACGSEASASG